MTFQNVSSIHFSVVKEQTCLVEGEKVNLEAARVFTGECFFGISYAFKVSNNESNESINSICIGEVFQVEVSDDLIHPF